VERKQLSILQFYGHDLLICSNGAKNPLKGKLIDDMKLRAPIIPNKGSLLRETRAEKRGK
jgi:hypothetical protein